MSGSEKWEVSDSKGSLLRLGGANTYFAGKDRADGSAIFSNVKYYNFCKTSFDINEYRPKIMDTHVPNDYLEISKDDINYYDSNSVEVPFTFKEVDPGEKALIYVRANKFDKMVLDSYTGDITIDWEVPV